MSCFKFGEIILPEKLKVSDWAVIACDQYTSDKEYWKKIESEVSEPTALNLIFPECYLSSDNSSRIESIIKKQNEYLENGIFKRIEGTILVKRTTPFGNERWGLMCLVNLDEYSAKAGGKTLIRATEGLVESRIPPRVEIRKNCPIELPHVMLLIDDENRTVIEPMKGRGEVVYDGELSGNGGRITGYNITDTTSLENTLNALLEKSVEKFGESLLFLVGDGNHSLATAKACRDESNPLSKYALVEVVNIYDEGLKFEPIHRVIFGANNEKFIQGLQTKTAGFSGKTVVYDGEKEMEIAFPEDAIEGVKLAQEYIDEYLKENEGEVDYIHGDETLKQISERDGAVGIALKGIDKSTFFSFVVKNGVLPRKTFSMGEADEKRYYLEARKVK